MAAISTPLVAMPTKQDIDKVSAVVQDLMRPEQEAMNAGRKTRAEVAQAATSLAEQADSEAAKLLLLKGAFNLYVRDGAFDEAVGTLKTLKETIPDMPPQIVANMIESSLRSVSKKNGGQLYRLLDETKTYIRYQNELKVDLARSAKEPANRMLHLKIAEKYAVLGNWTKALEEFTKGSDRKAADIAQAERGEKTDLTKKAIADFWWDYPVRKGEEIQKAFKQHAAAIYEAAIASGDISGLVKVQAERRIEEAKEFGELPAQESSLFAATTTKLRLASGVDLELIKCPAGEFTMGYECWKKFGAAYNRESRKTHQVKLTKDYMLGKYPVTYAQWYAVMRQGKKPPKELMNTPVGNITVQEMEDFCAKLTSRFKGSLGRKVFRLPTEAEWEYASKGGKNLDGLLGKDRDPDVAAVFRTLGYSGKDHALISNSGDPFYMWKALPVGKFEPNEWGFKDFIGNVREVTADTALDQNVPGDWTGDWKKSGEYLHPWNGNQQHYLDIEIDPLRHGQRHVARGGVSHDGWNGPSEKLTVDRNCKLPTLGFRVCVGEKFGDWNNATSSRPAESKVNDFKDPKKYCVIDISKGPKANRYSVTYMAEEPKGGWTDEYKGTKLVLRKVSAGTIIIDGQKKEFEKAFYAGVFEVTQKQLELVTGKACWERNHVMYGFNRPAVNVDFGMIRGNGKRTSADNDSFIGLLRKRTGLNIDLPTVSEWIYFGRAGSMTPFNNGGSTEDDLKMLGRYKGNKNDGKGGYTDGPSAVGMYLPNAWGIYDIHGGVTEWCLDNGKESPIRNPKWGEDKVIEKQRVVMGRHWDSDFSKDQYSGWVWPLDAKKWYMGFRIVAK